MVGWLREASGGWTVPLLVVLGAVAVMAAVGAPAAGGRRAQPVSEDVPGPVRVPVEEGSRG